MEKSGLRGKEVILISELIKKLEEVKNESGDLEVYYFPYDWAALSPLEKLVVSGDFIVGQTVLVIGDD